MPQWERAVDVVVDDDNDNAGVEVDGDDVDDVDDAADDVVPSDFLMTPTTKPDTAHGFRGVVYMHLVRSTPSYFGLQQRVGNDARRNHHRTP